MANQIVNVKKVSSQLKGIRKTIAKIEDIATTRALNILAAREKKILLQGISKQYGLPQSAFKEKIDITKATRVNKKVAISGKSTRAALGLPLNPKQLKGGGVTIVGQKRKRSRITGHIGGGSKAFLINAKKGGEAGGENIQVKGGNLKKIPVFRRRGSKGKVRTLQGSSVAGMMRKVGIKQKNIEKEILKNFPAEYRKQLKRAKFTGKR